MILTIMVCGLPNANITALTSIVKDLCTKMEYIIIIMTKCKIGNIDGDDMMRMYAALGYVPFGVIFVK